MSRLEIVESLAVANTLGEGVLWNARTRTVWWTDIQESRIFEYNPVSGELRDWVTPFRVACFGFLAGSEDLVVAFDRGIAIYSVDHGVLRWLVDPGELAEGVRFNDGKVDAKGRLWVGSMVEGRAVPASSAALYSCETGIGLVRHLGGITISNGLCWSPDGSLIYHADSPENRIVAYRFDLDRGTVSHPKLFAETPSDVYPDGSTVDAAGGVWNAQWGGGHVVRYDSDGKVDQVLELPVSQPTCVAFGGKQMDTLFVTSARDGLGPDRLTGEPEAGNLFVVKTAFKGLPGALFRGA